MIIAVLAAAPATVTEEESKLDIAARKFRLNVYATYRNHRKSYDEMIRAGETVMSLWEQNQNRKNSELVIDWFSQAGTAARRFGQPLPVVPTFEQTKQPKKQQTTHDNSVSSLSVPWPSSPERITFADAYLSTADRLSILNPQLLPTQPTPVDLSHAELDSHVVETPIAAYAIQRDDESGAFGNSIDLNMLIARIESENLRLKLLEERLNQADVDSTSELKLVAADFAQIVNNRRLTELYWRNLGPEQKRLTPRPLSLKTIEAHLDRLLENAP